MDYTDGHGFAALLPFRVGDSGIVFRRGLPSLFSIPTPMTSRTPILKVRVLLLCSLSLLTGNGLGAQSNYAMPYTFTTLAGKAGTVGTADGTASEARFKSPSSVAVDSTGNVYVADSAAIRKIAINGVVTILAGQVDSWGNADGIGSAARFDVCEGVAVDRAGIIYVADLGNHTIRKITPAGVVTTLAGKAGSPGSQDGKGSAASFHRPYRVAVDVAGNVYVSDNYNNTIRKITPAGVVTTLAGEAGHSGGGSEDGKGSEARFYDPRGLAVDAAGNVYVADYMNDTIRKITPDGVVTTLAGKAGSQKKAGAMGRTSLEDGPVDIARFAKPMDVAIDRTGNLYVADQFNRTIRKITPDGMVTTLAGKAGYDLNIYGKVVPAYGGILTYDAKRDGVPSPDGSGTGATAMFGMPVGLAVDAAGVIYVADTGLFTIRKGVPAAPGKLDILKMISPGPAP